MKSNRFKNLKKSIYLSCVVITMFFLVICCVDAQQTINASINHDNLERSYIIYIPESYTGDDPVPVVLNFHGYTSNAQDQMGYGDFRTVADQENFLVVHPQGTIDPSSGQTFWNAQWFLDGVDDIGFVSALIDSLAGEYNIDLSRVYSTGMSNGGFLSHTLACELSDKIAAIASVTGSMTIIQTSLTCNPANKTPIMQIHGTEDAVVPYGGNDDWMAPIDSVVELWVEKNNCNTEPIVTQIEDINTNDQSTVEKHLYTDCSEGGTVEFFIVDGGGHTWPGTAFSFGATNQDINASAEIWRFFSQYNLDGVITSSPIETIEDDIKIYPSLSTDYLKVEFAIKGVRHLSILSLDGKVLKQQLLNEKEIELDVNDLENGSYVLSVEQDGKITTKRFVKM